MKFLDNKTTQAFYQKNKIFSIFLSLIFVLILPELVIIFAPKYVLDFIWKQPITKFRKILFLSLSIVGYGLIIFYTITKLVFLFGKL